MLKNLANLVIKPIYRTNREHIHFGSQMSTEELEALRKEILKKVKICRKCEDMKTDMGSREVEKSQI